MRVEIIQVSQTPLGAASAEGVERRGDQPQGERYQEEAGLLDIVENASRRDSTSGLSVTNVINLSDIVLDDASLSLLSKGLNFCVSSKFNITEFQIDLSKSLRRMNLHTFFKNKQSSVDTQKMSGSDPVTVGPLGLHAS